VRNAALPAPRAPLALTVIILRETPRALIVLPKSDVKMTTRPLAYHRHHRNIFARPVRMVFGTTRENVKLAHLLVQNALPPPRAPLVLAVIFLRKMPRAKIVLRKETVMFTTWPLAWHRHHRNIFARPARMVFGTEKENV